MACNFPQQIALTTAPPELSMIAVIAVTPPPDPAVRKPSGPRCDVTPKQKTHPAQKTKVEQCSVAPRFSTPRQRRPNHAATLHKAANRSLFERRQGIVA